MKIEFSTSNAAFDDYGDEEIKRILMEIIEKVQLGYPQSSILDINGNVIGSWKI